jgi:RNA polymerase sigma-70 factor (ECF subfamily)
MISGTSATEMQRDERAGGSDLPGLMARYQQGDALAVEGLVRSLSPRLFRFFVGAGVATADAEDLVQDCWVRIHRSRHTYRCPEPVLPWIFAIAHHTQLDSYRRRRRRESREVLVSEPPETAARIEQQPAVGEDEFLRLLETLPESQREVILMLKVSGMSIEEVARATSSTSSASYCRKEPNEDVWTLRRMQASRWGIGSAIRLARF